MVADENSVETTGCELILDGELVNEVEKDIQADRILLKIMKLQEEIDSFKNQMDEAVRFYDTLIYGVQKQIGWCSNLLRAYAERSGKKTLKYPNGKLRLTKLNRASWCDDATLVAFSYENNIDTNVTEKPDKKKILAYIHETGEMPEGFKEEESTSFTYQTK